MKSFYEFQRMMEQNPVPTNSPAPAAQNLAAGANLDPVDPAVKQIASTLGTNKPMTNTFLNLVRKILNPATRNAFFNLFRTAQKSTAPQTGTTQTKTQTPMAAGSGMAGGVSPNAAANAGK